MKDSVVTLVSGPRRRAGMGHKYPIRSLRLTQTYDMFLNQSTSGWKMPSITVVLK